MSPSVNLMPRPHALSAGTSLGHERDEKKVVKIGPPGKNASEEDQAGAEENPPPEFRGANFFARIMLRDIEVWCRCEGIKGGGQSGQDSHGSRWSRAGVVNSGCAKLKARRDRHAFILDAHREGNIPT